MVFNSVNCTSGLSCQVIPTLNTYTAPGCADAAKVNGIFPNLKLYYTENESLKTNMIDELSGAGTNTPETKFFDVRTKFKSAFNEFDVIKTRLVKTLQHANTFVKGFKEITNCRMVRKELLAWEAAICFGFNNNLFYFFLFLFFFLDVSAERVVSVFALGMLILRVKNIDHEIGKSVSSQRNLSPSCFESHVRVFLVHLICVFEMFI